MRKKTISKEERRGAKAFEKHQRALEIEKQRRQLAFPLAETFYHMYENQWYKDVLGDEKATWSAYLSQVEVMFSRHRVKYMIEVYRYFILERKFDPEELSSYPMARLIDIVKCIESDDQADELLAVAGTALPQDWRDTLAEVTGKVTSENCEHTFTELKICETCGKRVRHDH